MDCSKLKVSPKSKNNLGSGPTFPALLFISFSTSGLKEGAAAGLFGLYLISGKSTFPRGFFAVGVVKERFVAL